MSSTCNVPSCQNDRRYPKRWVVMPHVAELKFHRPRDEDYAKWERKMDRTDYKVTTNTRVCSNHFRYGKPLHQNHVPSMYLRSYPSWVVQAHRVEGQLSHISDDLVCEVLAHMCQYVHNLELIKPHLQQHEQTGITSSQQLAAQCLILQKAEARSLIAHVIPLIPTGKCVEALAIFKHGAEVDGARLVKRGPVPVSVDFNKSVLSVNDPSSDVIEHVRNFHSYCSTDVPEVPVSDHSYSSTTVVTPDHADDNQEQEPHSLKKQQKPCKKMQCKRRTQMLENKIKMLERTVKRLKLKVYNRTREHNEKQKQNLGLETDIAKKQKPKKAKISITIIQKSDSLMALHTGLPSYALFKWVFDQVHDIASKMTYWDGSGIEATEGKRVRSGRSKTLIAEDELLMTLMKLKLNLSGDYLSFLFGVSSSTVSSVVSTWILMLSKELAGLIYWPSRSEVVACYPDCFRRWPNITAILDCFEIPTERPSHVEANSQIFSAYKNRPTSKFLLACTPGGSISYISQAAGGNMSDKEFVINSGILNNFRPGDQCMTDKGFRIEGELLEHGVQLIIPPFVRKGKPFTAEENNENKHIAHSRIHVERVIGRARNFSYMNGTIPVNQLDLVSPAVTVCCALTNLKNSVVVKP